MDANRLLYHVSSNGTIGPQWKHVLLLGELQSAGKTAVNCSAVERPSFVSVQWTPICDVILEILGEYPITGFYC